MKTNWTEGGNVVFGDHIWNVGHKVLDDFLSQQFYANLVIVTCLMWIYQKRKCAKKKKKKKKNSKNANF